MKRGLKKLLHPPFQKVSHPLNFMFLAISTPRQGRDGCFIKYTIIMNKTVFFQPKGMKSIYCEAGMILANDPDHIHYFDEPCKIHISEVKIIDMSDVIAPKNRNQPYIVKSNLNKSSKS